MTLSRIVLAVLTVFMAPSYTFSEENPGYSEESQTLTIPSVDAGGSPGLYQEIEFELMQGNDWRMITAREGRKVREIANVELVQTQSFPVQIFLKISGRFSNGCPKLGKMSHALAGSDFNVAVYYRPQPEFDGTVVCTQAEVDFSTYMPLPVYGLDAGVYTYTVNDEVLTKNNSGTFTLTQKNAF